MRRFVLFHPKMRAFAEQFAEAENAQTLEIERNLFPNGNADIKIGLEPILDSFEKVSVVYFSFFEDLGDKKMEEYIIWVLADTLNIDKFTVVDMYDPMATMERVLHGDEGRIATENVEAAFWKTLPSKTFRILFDHHALQNRFFFTLGSTKIWFESAVSLVFPEIDAAGIDAIAFPDAGATKRFGSSFKGLVDEVITCAKVRPSADSDKRIVTILDGFPENRHVLIVDDLVRSGNTLIECAKALRKAGAAKVSMFVTHAEFPQASWMKFVNLDLIERFYISDTVFPVANHLEGFGKFKVLSVFEMVENLLRKIEK